MMLRGASALNSDTASALNSGTASVLCRECLWLVVDLKTCY